LREIFAKILGKKFVGKIFGVFFAGKNCEKIARKKIGEISGIFLREN
jgi:hypothetical protein